VITERASQLAGAIASKVTGIRYLRSQGKTRACWYLWSRRDSMVVNKADFDDFVHRGKNSSEADSRYNHLALMKTPEEILKFREWDRQRILNGHQALQSACKVRKIIQSGCRRSCKEHK
jgi:hypothetical protein